MRATTALMTLGCLALLVSSATGCDDKPSCDNAMRNYYNSGCAIAIYNPNQQILEESEARNWCNSAEERAQDCGCEDLHLDLIDCLQKVEIAACYDCDDQLVDFQECANMCQL